MKGSHAFIVAAVLAGVASLASAQMGPHAGGLPATAGLGANPPLLFNPRPSVGPTTPTLSYGASPALGGYGSSLGSGYTEPSPLTAGPAGSFSANPLSPTTRFPSVTCHPGGCSGLDGTQYARGAGNVLFGSNGKVCQFTAPGAPLVCN